MFRDLLEFAGYKLKRVARSRLFPLTIVFCVMFTVLVFRLFHLHFFLFFWHVLAPSEQNSLIL